MLLVSWHQKNTGLQIKKRFDISKSADKSKAYAYLSRKGFASDEIKEALNPSEWVAKYAETGILKR